MESPQIFIIGSLRIQVLSPTLVRLEDAGPIGFEDRTTFHILRREIRSVQCHREQQNGLEILHTPQFSVEIPAADASTRKVVIRAPNGSVLFSGSQDVPSRIFLPHPSAPTACWAFADHPRIVPPTWGATPPPGDLPSSGWDRSNSARDLYVCIPGRTGYLQIREDFLHLTGTTPLPSLSALGLIDSRYYPYTQDEALEVMETYHRKQIPLDIFVLDTDWRVGASHGYEVNTTLLPDIRSFFDACHRRSIEVMLNDHPEPVDPDAASPAELRYRFEGLRSLLDLGADYWWFDRNWHVSLGSPMEGLSKEVWGMRLYHDMVQRARPGRRPMIMSNVEGVDNGWLNQPSSPAAHRFPIWWTGDTRAAWDHLERGIQTMTASGVRSLLPYVSEDLGGHHDTPDPELYTRFAQYGALSPICRLHCSYKLHRFPWMFGEEAEKIVSDYIRLRYRLLPTLYTAAAECAETGRPLCARCDLDFPSEQGASNPTQYLLGHDLLVAPVYRPVVPFEVVPASLLRRPDGQPGVQAEYFYSVVPEGPAACTRTEEAINHGWYGKPPAAGLDGKHFSARWETILGPVAEAGTYRIGVRTDDGIRLWISGQLVLDGFDAHGDIHRWADVRLEAGATVPIRLEYRCFGTWHTMCELRWGRHPDEASPREVWIPPGAWMDAWTGEIVEGPCTTLRPCPLNQVPMFVQSAGIVLTAPQRVRTGTPRWDHCVADIFLHGEKHHCERWLYEDDGKTDDYHRGACSITSIEFHRRPQGATLLIHPPTNAGFAPAERTWTIRLHGCGERLLSATIDGRSVAHALIRGADRSAGIVFPTLGKLPSPSYPTVVEITLKDLPVRPTEPCMLELEFDRASK